MTRQRLISFAGIIAALICTHATAQDTTLISVSGAGDPNNDVCKWGSVSPDGRFVAFTSEASNLVPNDTNGEEDAFVRDLITNQTMRVSVSSTGAQSDSFSWGSALTADGRYVAFYCDADLAGDGASNGVFLHDRVTGVTRNVHVSSDGTPGGSMVGVWGRLGLSASGRFVVFDTPAPLVPEDTGNFRDIYVHDRDFDANGVFDEPDGINTIRMSVSSSGEPANGESRMPFISSNGRFVTFDSFATNLVDNDTNGDRDIFIHDRDPDENGIFDEPGAISITRGSVATGGKQASVINTWWSSITDDGRYVVFHSAASDLVPNDTNATVDVFIHDRLTIETARISLTQTGDESSGVSGMAQISNDGRFITYLLWEENVAGSEVNLKVYDRLNASTRLANLNWLGEAGDLALTGASNPLGPAMTPDGRFIAFLSESPLVPNASPGVISAYLRDRGPGFLADINGDGPIDVNDLLLFIGGWGPCPAAPVPCPADINGDGTVDVNDLLVLVGNWS